MSRSGYSDDPDKWQLIKWRGQVASAIRGKRGQMFLLSLLRALDALPEKKLIASDLQDEQGCVCALGALAVYRGIDPTKLDTYDYEQLGNTFDIAHQLAQEVMYKNDDYYRQTPEERFTRMRAWVVANLTEVET